jgi:hypothetical protein
VEVLQCSGTPSASRVKPGLACHPVTATTSTSYTRTPISIPIQPHRRPEEQVSPKKLDDRRSVEQFSPKKLDKVRPAISSEALFSCCPNAQHRLRGRRLSRQQQCIVAREKSMIRPRPRRKTPICMRHRPAFHTRVSGAWTCIQLQAW